MNDFQPISTCPNHAAYRIRNHNGESLICKPCLQHRHCGNDFTILNDVQVSQCECRHMPGRLERDEQRCTEVFYGQRCLYDRGHKGLHSYNRDPLGVMR